MNNEFLKQLITVENSNMIDLSICATYTRTILNAEKAKLHYKNQF